MLWQIHPVQINQMGVFEDRYQDREGAMDR